MIRIIYKFFELVKYNIEYIFMKKNHYKFIDDKKLVDIIVSQNKSITRFGDGEFKWILNIPQNSFQVQDENLRKELIDIITKTENKNIIICINKPINDISQYTFKAKCYWKRFLVKYSKELKKYLDNEYSYGDSNITRPYMDYKVKNRNIIKNKFSNLRRIWNNKNIIFVEGEMTRLGIGNDLFDNAKSIKRIICPSKNAYQKVNKIEEYINHNINKDYLLLIALGPTATILSYRLSNNGFQAIDIGHIDIEYMWFLKKARKKVKIEGKYVNEVGGKPINNNKIDDEYNNQIIKRIL